MKVFAGLAVLLVLVAAAAAAANHKVLADPPTCPEAIPGVVLNITFYPNEDDCSKYWECDNGNLYNGSCSDGLVWNPTLDACDWPYNYDCPYDKMVLSLLPTAEITCPQPSPGEQMNVTFYPDETDCSKYYECVNGVLINLTCPGDLIWNADIDTCDWSYNYDCPYDKMVLSLLTTAEITCPQPSPGEQMNVTFYPDETDCSKYYECVNGVLINLTCPGDLIWNADIDTCDWAYNYDCPYDKKRRSVSEINSFVCPPVNPSMLGIPTYHPNDQDVQKYWECLDGKVRGFSCDRDKIWDPSVEECVTEFN